MVKVSVIIPSYNRVKLLDRAIRSVLRQTAACAEIIVVDDGSTDQTAECVRNLAETSDIPIHYFHQDNMGPAAARNLGIQQAQSALIAFLDSDDHWRKDKLACQLGAMQEYPGVLISYTREQWLREGVHLNQKKKHIPRHGDIFAQCLQFCVVGMSTVMARKELFEEAGCFSPDFRCCEDYDFWLRVSCRYPFFLVDKPLTIKEGGREDQVSSQYRIGMDRLHIQAITRLLESEILNEEQRDLALKALQQKCRIFGYGCIKHGKDEEGREYLQLYEKYR